MARERRSTSYMLCVKNDGYLTSLELRKIYRCVADAKAASHGLVRITDESGENYLYPAICFIPIEVPRAAARALDAET